MAKDIKVLGIESSCDDSCAAIVTSSKQILSNIVISQHKEHAPFQGVVPEIAARSHMNNLERAITHVLNEANLHFEDLDAIAATNGPGLIGGVIVGALFGRAIASVLQKPFIAINHLEGHALTIRLTESIDYPYLLLLVSGGHCQFIIVKKLSQYQILGQTLDDAVGEAFDKVAKMLGLDFPGGPEIERRAIKGNPHKYTLPKPILHRVGCDMPFSGLKTAIRILIEQLGDLSDQNINDIAASFQYTIGLILTAKMFQAIETYQNTLNNEANPIIVVAGGVAANKYIKEVLTIAASRQGFKLLTPPIDLCTDNAAMIAYTAIERLQQNLISKDFIPKAKWDLEELNI